MRNLVGDPDAIAVTLSSRGGGIPGYRSAFLTGTQTLLQAFPGTRILFTSSTSVYGQTDGSDVDESSPTEPERETGRILLEAERIVLSHGGIVARLAGMYGPGRSVLLRKFLAREATIEGDGARWINQVHVSDAASALLHLLQRSDITGEVFNVCDNGPISQTELYQRLAEKTGLPLPPPTAISPNRKRAWTNKRVSNLKLLRTGWTPEYPDIFAAINNQGLNVLAGTAEDFMST